MTHCDAFRHLSKLCARKRTYTEKRVTICHASLSETEQWRGAGVCPRAVHQSTKMESLSIVLIGLNLLSERSAKWCFTNHMALLARASCKSGQSAQRSRSRMGGPRISRKRHRGEPAACVRPARPVFSDVDAAERATAAHKRDEGASRDKSFRYLTVVDPPCAREARGDFAYSEFPKTRFPFPLKRNKCD